MQLQPKNFLNLREKYPVFDYVGFSACRMENTLKISYRYEIAPDICFEPALELSLTEASLAVIDTPSFNNLIFHLGLIESFSYWKSTCSPTIRIKAGYLNTSQLLWWKNLLIKGMGEFFYVNGIDFTSSDFVHLECISEMLERQFPPFPQDLQKRALLLVGGGRDSAITAMCFQQTAYPNNCLILNNIPSALAVTAAVGCDSPIIVSRTLDTRLLILNKRGFLNGHTPFSAYLAFLSALCLPLYDYAQIVVSNEKSSDEGNITYFGQTINHQYSKSSEFEVSFNEYLHKYLVCKGEYVSFTRHLNELQTGKIFSKLPGLFGIIKSCNRNQKEGTWCGECPKCLSVFLSTYPFISASEIQAVFGADFFENSQSIPVLERLTGVRDHKPFECVGTTEEMKAALYLCLQKVERTGKTLPVALQHMKKSFSFDEDFEMIARSFLTPSQQHIAGHPALVRLESLL